MSFPLPQTEPWKGEPPAEHGAPEGLPCECQAGREMAHAVLATCSDMTGVF